jgi:hypothetical protein
MDLFLKYVVNQMSNLKNGFLVQFLPISIYLKVGAEREKD